MLVFLHENVIRLTTPFLKMDGAKKLAASVTPS